MICPSDKMTWKDVPGYEGFYQVSDAGSVRNARTMHEVKPYTNEHGYSIVGLYNRNASKTVHYRVHRLVADAFLENPNAKRTVNHKDGNKANNHMHNLEWATHKENSRHAHDTGLIVASEKQRAAASKNIQKNRLFSKPERRCFLIEDGNRKEFGSVKAAAEYVSGVSSGVTTCCQGKRKTYKGFCWGYC